MLDTAVSTRLDQLRAKLKARTDQPGFKQNCEALRKEISRLETVASRALDS